jgi:hypothetical protein
MSDTVILNNNNPAVAEFVDAWRKKYQKTYDFSDPKEQATFYEGMLEIARHVATNTATGTLAVAVGTEAVSEVRVAATPAPKPSAS